MKILNQSQCEYLETQAKRLEKKSRKFLLGGLILAIPLIILLKLVGILLVIIFFGLAVDYEARASHYKKGIEGEKMVVSTLEELDNTWLLINDVKLSQRGGNIDHILLSPQGIFTIETKHLEGSIRCYQDEWSKRRKHRKKYLPRYFQIRSVSKQAEYHAFSLRRFLRAKCRRNFEVIPLCVFTNPKVKLKLIKPTVKILKIGELVKFLWKAKSEELLPEKDINLISQFLLDKVERTNP